MKSMHVLSVTTALAAAALVSVPGAAQAAAPTNDSWESPTEIGALPFTATQDTTEATPDEPPAGWCYGTGHAVWYRFAPQESRQLAITTAGSDYRTALDVYEATDAATPPEQWNLVACDARSGPGNTAATGLRARADHVYYVRVTGLRDTDTGTLALSVHRAIRGTATLDAHGRVDSVDGSAIVHGTLRCTRTGSLSIWVSLRQRVGAFVAAGDQRHSFACGPESSTWRLRVAPGGQVGFAPGVARVASSHLYACEPGACSNGKHLARDVVRLHH